MNIFILYVLQLPFNFFLVSIWIMKKRKLLSGNRISSLMVAIDLDYMNKKFF